MGGAAYSLQGVQKELRQRLYNGNPEEQTASQLFIQLCWLRRSHEMSTSGSKLDRWCRWLIDILSSKIEKPREAVEEWLRETTVNLIRLFNEEVITVKKWVLFYYDCMSVGEDGYLNRLVANMSSEALWLEYINCLQSQTNVVQLRLGHFYCPIKEHPPLVMMDVRQINQFVFIFLPFLPTVHCDNAQNLCRRLIRRLFYHLRHN